MSLIRLFVFLFLGAAASWPAHAQTFQVYQPGTITLGDFTLSLSGCSYILNNVTQASCSSDNLDVDATVNSSGNVLTLTYLNQKSPSSALMNQATAGGCTCVYYTLGVTSTAPISSALLSDTGYNSQSGNVLNNQATFTTLSGAPEIQATIASGQSAATASQTFAANTTNVSVYFGLGQNGAYNGSTLSLNSASVIFTAAPEPATIALFLTGLIGLAGVRWGWRRSSR